MREGCEKDEFDERSRPVRGEYCVDGKTKSTCVTAAAARCSDGAGGAPTFRAKSAEGALLSKSFKLGSFKLGI